MPIDRDHDHTGLGPDLEHFNGLSHDSRCDKKGTESDAEICQGLVGDLNALLVGFNDRSLQNVSQPPCFKRRALRCTGGLQPFSRVYI
ncbi:MAG: hypothetical protein WCF90_02640 [Methanomicrobiales archaeon]